MNGKAWLIGILSLAISVGAVSVGAAASDGKDIRRLMMENRIAAEIARLNLTPGQTEELKSALEHIKSHREETRDQLAGLLTERRDALFDRLDTVLDLLD